MNWSLGRHFMAYGPWNVVFRFDRERFAVNQFDPYRKGPYWDTMIEYRGVMYIIHMVTYFISLKEKKDDEM